MALITSAELISAVAARLKVEESQLPPFWPGLCEDSVAAASADISSRLQRKGYSAAQVAAADQLGFWSRSLALFWALTHGGAYSGYEAETIKALDIRKDIDAATLLVSGEIVSPTDSKGAVASSGACVGTGTGSLFNFPGTDTVTNETTQW